jgi:hypothetical protein
MMKRIQLHSTLISLLLLIFTIQVNGQCVLKTDGTEIGINKSGYFTTIKVDNKEILSSAQYPLITACSEGRLIEPVRMEQKGSLLKLKMSDGNLVQLKSLSNPTCITLEVVDIPIKYDALLFGPLKITIHEVVGDVIGVAQGNGVAFGIQGLNIKTNAGIPDEYVEAVKAKYNNSGKSAELSTGTVIDSRLAACDINDGTFFQFSCRRRNKTEYRTVNNLKHSLVLPVEGPDALIKGAKIAIFGSTKDKALARIGMIEQKEGLPHPMFGNEWGKTAQAAMESYLITDYNEDNLDFVLGMAKKAGFKYVYNPGPFNSWGHFTWDKSFTKSGDEGVKKMVDRAKVDGISLGVHTLSNFLTTNDAYVTPIPSTHLLKQGALKLVSDITAEQKDILIQKSDLFSLPMTLNAMQIDNELIRFGSTEQQGDNLLLKNCQRGAFHTTAANHAKTAALYKLWDYPYNTLFPDLSLQDAFADRLAEIFNKTGLCQTSFDGLEGCRYTGQDDYATARFVSRFYNQLNHNVVNDASNLNHFTWHMHSRMNWGEPWGEAMRTGQVENRIKNQLFFRRNLFPRMLGWFLIRLGDKKFECSSLEDLEWALSESAGFDAGYAMTIDINTLHHHGQINALLDAIKNWDYLRECHAFNEEQRTQLRDPKTEWHLAKIDDTHFSLFPLSISKHYHCNLSEMQPGQPGGADWSIDTPYAGGYDIRLKVDGEGSISDPSFTTQNGVIKFPCELSDSQYLLYSNGKAVVTDKNYNVLQEVVPEGKSSLPAGSSSISFSVTKMGTTAPDVTVRFITRGKAENIIVKK